MKKEITILLDNIRSTHNVGSIFRTGDAAGVKRIFLSGITSAPLDRFGRPQKEIAKTALGAEKDIKWIYYKSPLPLIAKLKREGFEIVGVEQDPKALDYWKFVPKKRTLLIFGNEVKGLSRALRSRCDSLIEIPMHGAMVQQAHHPRHTRRGKESLNVSVAAGIILYQAIRNVR